MSHDEASVARTIIQQVQVETLLARAQEAGDFRALIGNSVTDGEAIRISRIWEQVWSELPEKAVGRIRAALIEDAWVLDHVFLKALRAHNRPALVRGTIKAVGKEAATLEKRFVRIASELADLAGALHDTLDEGINIVAAGSERAALEVVLSIADLRAQLEKLAQARDLAIKDTGRRPNAARSALARDVVYVWQANGLGIMGDDREALDVFIGAAVRTIETTKDKPFIGKGQEEWLPRLVDDAIKTVAASE